MRYVPHSEEDILSMNIIEEGVYKFKVMEVLTVDKYGAPMQDKNGNDMAKLKLAVWDKNNREHSMSTYISGDSRFAYKLRHFANTIGMLTSYENGSFKIHETLGKAGQAQIVIKKGNAKNDGSGDMWPDRNDVKDFVVNAMQVPNGAEHQSSPNDLSDDCPF